MHGKTLLKNMKKLGLPWIIMQDFMQHEKDKVGRKTLEVTHEFNGTWEQSISESEWLNTCNSLLPTFNAWTMEQLIEEKDERVKDNANSAALRGIGDYFKQMQNQMANPFDKIFIKQ